MLSQISDRRMTRGQRSVNVGRREGAGHRSIRIRKESASSPPTQQHYNKCVVLTSPVPKNPLPFLFPRLGRREGILLQEECEQCARPRKIFGIRAAFIRARGGVVDQRRRWRWGFWFVGRGGREQRGRLAKRRRRRPTPPRHFLLPQRHFFRAPKNDGRGRKPTINQTETLSSTHFGNTL